MGEKKGRAAALRYDRRNDPAPRLVAKGSGEVARQILRLAREHGIPVREDPMLVEALCALDLHEAIPEELYRVIAELFAFLYRLRREAGLAPSEKCAGDAPKAG